MAKLKNYPKRPKANASAAVMERYLQRCKDVDKQNAEIKKEAAKRENLKKQISKIGRAK
jgi:hypothetical protein